jgi:hypothetical protein
LDPEPPSLAEVDALSPKQPSRMEISFNFFGYAPLAGTLGCSLLRSDEGWAWVHHKEHLNSIVDRADGFGDRVSGFMLVIRFR